MKHVPRISIVIPMYNAEKFIDNTIKSILLQTFEDFELIIVDDKSTDRSIQVVENFKDPRIRLIKSFQNSHEWNARNLGLQFASGEYVYFVDHDDMLLPNALEILWRGVEKSDADSIHFNSYYTNVDERFGLNEDVQVVQFIDSMPPDQYLPKDVEWRLLQKKFTFSVMAWQKLIRREFLFEHGIYFPPIWISSDSLHFFAELCLARKIFVVNDAGYIYRQNPTNQMRTDSLKKLRYVTENFKPMLDYMEEIFAKDLVSPISRESQIQAEIERADLICMKFAAESYESGIPIETINSIIDEQIRNGLMLDEKSISMLFHLATFGREDFM